MKRIRDSRSWTVPPVHLHRKALDDIIEVLSEGGSKVAISSGAFEYESLDELREHAGIRPKELCLQSREPFLSLSFGRGIISGGHLFGSNSPDAESRFLRVKEILESQRRAIARYPRPGGALLISVGLVLLIVALPKAWLAAWGEWQKSLVLFTAFYGPPLLSLSIHSGYTWVVDLELHKPGSSFWTRKKDDILLLLIGAFVGALLTWLLGK